jgi:hypothetical protein
MTRSPQVCATCGGDGFVVVEKTCSRCHGHGFLIGVIEYRAVARHWKYCGHEGAVPAENCECDGYWETTTFIVNEPSALPHGDG